MRQYGVLVIRDNEFTIYDGEGKVVLKIENLQGGFCTWGKRYIWEKCSIFDMCSQNGWNVLFKEDYYYVVYKEI